MKDNLPTAEEIARIRAKVAGKADRWKEFLPSDEELQTSFDEFQPDPHISSSNSTSSNWATPPVRPSETPPVRPSASAVPPVRPSASAVPPVRPSASVVPPARPTAPEVSPVSLSVIPHAKPATSQSSLTTRYTDAYLVARTINGVGQTIKIAGLVLGALIAIVGFAAVNNFGGGFAFAALLFGVVVALGLYVLGVLVSAQGQILKASLDTAVNSSPLLSHEEIRQILTL